jgi:hypothetical protein
MFFYLSSVHSLVLITLTAYALNQEKQLSLSIHTNWEDFKRLINKRVTLIVSLKAKEDTEAGTQRTPQ